MKRLKFKGLIKDGVFIFLGTVAYSLGIVGFLEPAEISPGGLTGIATVFNFLFDLPTGLMLFLLNLPLLVLGLIKLGGGMTIKTVISTALASLIIDTMEMFLKPLSNDPIICALAGGVLMGTGMGLLFLHGSTSGGTDIAAKLLQLKYPYVSTGRLILILDAIVITFATIVYGNFESALYSVLSILVSTTVIDRLLYGNGGGKLAFIITENPDEIKNRIYTYLKRGVSECSVRGGYSGSGKTMLLCALRRQQAGEFLKAVKDIDKDSFIILTEAGETFGQGF